MKPNPAKVTSAWWQLIKKGPAFRQNTTFCYNLKYNQKLKVLIDILNGGKKMNTIIVSAFHLCGKTYAKEHSDHLLIEEVSYSDFSWRINKCGRKVPIKGEGPWLKFVEQIKSLQGKVDIILVDGGLKTREVLTDNGLTFVSVLPEPWLANEWTGRYYRNQEFGFKNYHIEHSYSFVCHSILPYGKKVFRLQSGEYLSDILEKIVNDYPFDDEILFDIKKILKYEYNNHRTSISARGHYEVYSLSKNISFDIYHNEASIKLTVNMGPCSNMSYDFLECISDEDGEYWVINSEDTAEAEAEIMQKLNITDIIYSPTKAQWRPGPPVYFTIDRDDNLFFSAYISVPLLNKTIY